MNTMPDESTHRLAIETPAERRSQLMMLAKRCVQGLFVGATLPRLLAYRATRAVLGSRAFSASSESIARIPGLRGVYSRQAFYGSTLEHCGADVYFGWLSVFSMTEARVGDRVYIGRFCSLGFADLGDEVMLADGVQILSGGHEHTRGNSTVSMQSQPQHYQRVSIGRGSWIGAGAVIMANVGEQCVIGAGAVVNKPIPSYSIAVGVPARVVRSLASPSFSSVTEAVLSE